MQTAAMYFLNDGINLVVDGDFLRADNTTLGGDDGIALAYALAILEDDNIQHPALEAVFTVDEEVGMDGAIMLDETDLKGTQILELLIPRKKEYCGRAVPEVCDV